MKKSKTIADLKINWTFTNREFTDFQNFNEVFYEKNSHLKDKNYKLVDKYNDFTVKLPNNLTVKWWYKPINSNNSLADFMYHTHNYIANILNESNMKMLSLDRFEFEDYIWGTCFHIKYKL